MSALLQTAEGAPTATALDRVLAETTDRNSTFQTAVQTALRQYRQRLADGMRGLREANGGCRTAFRAFSEGGNFSGAEIDEHTTLIQALATQV